MHRFDAVIIGAGAIGLALARQLAETLGDGSGIALLDQETGFGQHTSSRSSEVIHAGIYYPTGSRKARLCVRGKALLYRYCESRGIAAKRLGKLIIAQTGDEQALDRLRQQALANGVEDLVWLDRQEILRREPHVNAGVALWSPSSGILDSHHFMASLLSEATASGVVWAPCSRVDRITPQDDRVGWVLHCEHLPRDSRRPGAGSDDRFTIATQWVINCAGLGAQALAAQIQGIKSQSVPALYPCKGTYYSYSGRSPFQHLIYPLPEAGLAGLGIHATLDLAGQCRFGPDTEYVDALDYSVSRKAQSRFVSAIRRYFPDLDERRLAPAYSGIRPKLSGPGMPWQDFEFQGPQDHGHPGLWQLFGIESPGLTASLAIAEELSTQIHQAMQGGPGR
ncbi:MAG: hypothetical protein RLZZ385_178 [Pseudomonadota bacterium]|jgi:L-2-hydroxyglutarate oxidase LhgO